MPALAPSRIREPAAGLSTMNISLNIFAFAGMSARRIIYHLRHLSFAHTAILTDLSCHLRRSFIIQIITFEYRFYDADFILQDIFRAAALRLSYRFNAAVVVAFRHARRQHF